MAVTLKLYFFVKECDPLEETGARQCDIDVLERQQNYDEDWVSLSLP